jgi:peptidoglycan/xylan/chitin deacetylase (PgdA/CDA1 family)
MRLDRFLTLYFFSPLCQLFKPKGLRIPILMYHSISDEPETGHPYFWINTSPKRFEEQMKFLHDNDYQVISLTEAADLISNTQMIPDSVSTAEHIEKTFFAPQFETYQSLKSKYVVLTFDDAFLDFYEEAFPVLSRFGFCAIVFIPTSCIDRGLSLRGKSHLDWHKVKELKRNGIDFGSHTIDHLQLYQLDRNIVESQISESKQRIEEILGEQIKSFSYPYAFPTENKNFKVFLREILMKEGYEFGTGTEIGTAMEGDDALFLKRLPVNSADDIQFFECKIRGAYDWLSKPQTVVKQMKAILRDSRGYLHSKGEKEAIS